MELLFTHHHFPPFTYLFTVTGTMQQCLQTVVIAGKLRSSMRGTSVAISLPHFNAPIKPRRNIFYCHYVSQFRMSTITPFLNKSSCGVRKLHDPNYMVDVNNFIIFVASQFSGRVNNSPQTKHIDRCCVVQEYGGPQCGGSV